MQVLRGTGNWYILEGVKYFKAKIHYYSDKYPYNYSYSFLFCFTVGKIHIRGSVTTLHIFLREHFQTDN